MTATLRRSETRWRCQHCRRPVLVIIEELRLRKVKVEIISGCRCVSFKDQQTYIQKARLATEALPRDEYERFFSQEVPT